MKIFDFTPNLSYQFHESLQKYFLPCSINQFHRKIVDFDTFVKKYFSNNLKFRSKLFQGLQVSKSKPNFHTEYWSVSGEDQSQYLQIKFIVIQRMENLHS